MSDPARVPAVELTHRRAFLAALLSVLGVVLYMVGPYLLALFLGGTLAMLALPVQHWLKARWGRPAVSAGATGNDSWIGRWAWGRSTAACADMHPLAGFVAVLGGIQMFGIVGVFIGPIMAAMLLTLLKIWPSVRGKEAV